MSYTPTNWVNGETPINAANLNKIEQQLVKDSASLEAINQDLSKKTEELAKVTQDIAENTEKLGEVEQDIAENAEKIGNVEQAVGENAEKLGEVEQAVDANTEKLGKVENDLDDTAEKLAEVEKKLGSLDRFYTEQKVESVGYAVDNPPYSTKYAKICKIGGLTRKCTNLFGGDALADKFVEIASATKDANNGTVTYTAQNVHQKNLFEDFKPDTQYTIILKGYNSSEKQTSNLCIYYTDGTKNTDSFFFTNGILVAVSAEGKSIQSLGGFWNTSNVTLYYNECGVFEGVLTENDFDTCFTGLRSAPVTAVESSVGETLPIPEAVQALDGYGEGINDTCYNYIDWEKKQYVRNVKTIVLTGDENYTTTSAANSFATSASGGKQGLQNQMLYNCSVYSAVPYYERSDKTMSMYTGYSTAILFLDSSYSTIDEFKAHVRELYESGNPIMVVYPLATPVVTDISDLLADNSIPVESGGTLTFVNEHKYAVPVESVYCIDLIEKLLAIAEGIRV